MHDSAQINLPPEVLIQNNFRVCSGRVSTFQCGECSFHSHTENNHNLQSLVFLLDSISPSQLFAATTQLKT